MPQNKNLDSQLNEHLRQHFDTQPRPDFLPALKSELMGKVTANQSLSRLHKTRRTAWVLASALTALVLILFITPVRDAIGQVFVELFQQAESNVIPYPPGQTAIAGYTQTAALGPTTTPVASATNTPNVTKTPNPSSITDAHLTIEEIEEEAGFDVLVPATVPSIFKFTGGAYVPEDNMSFLFYDLVGRTSNGLRISQEPVTGMEDCNLCSDIGPAANVHTVQIGDTTGEFVTGVWMLDDGYRIWKNDAWLGRLRWQSNDTVFEIMFFGPPNTMTKNDMAHLAQSMTSSNAPLAGFNLTPTVSTPETTKTPDPSKMENANMTIAEVEQAAGFDILIPSYLVNQTFYGANYDANSNISYLFYEEGLTIRQEPFTDKGDCDLCKEVRNGASFKYVQLGDNEAEYLFGIWQYKDQNNVITTDVQPKQLRWQVNNTFFDITYDHDPSELELDDLIAIAESLQ